MLPSPYLRLSAGKLVEAYRPKPVPGLPELADARLYTDEGLDQGRIGYAAFEGRAGLRLTGVCMTRGLAVGALRARLRSGRGWLDEMVRTAQGVGRG